MREYILTVTTLLALTATGAIAENTNKQESLPSENVSKIDRYPRLGLSLNSELSVNQVVPGSPADKAGLMAGDRFVSIDGQQVSESNRRRTVKLLVGEVGTVAHMVVVRDGKQYSVAVTRALPEKSARMSTEAISGQNVAPPATPVKTCKATASAQSTSQPTALDRDLVKNELKGAHADEIYAQIMKGLSMLPVDVKQFLLNANVFMLITHSRGELDNTHGGCCYQIKNNKIVITEVDDANNKALPVQRLPITTLHELGHAYDHNSGHISALPAYRVLYDREASAVPVGKRKLLAYFLPDGDSYAGHEMKRHSSPEECFASLFASKYFVGTDMMLSELKKAFPETYKFVADSRP